MKHRGSFPHRMETPDRHKGQSDKRTNERTDGRSDDETIRPSVHAFVSWMEFDTYRTDVTVTPSIDDLS